MALYSQRFDDIYFSPEQGWAETDHVFIRANNLADRVAAGNNLTICETGFGSGLNFLAAWNCLLNIRSDNASDTCGGLHFISFEKYPLQKQDLEALRAVVKCDTQLLDQLIHTYPDHAAGLFEAQLSQAVRLSIYFMDMNETLPLLKSPVDMWFLDGFAPAKNRDMWSEILFENMARLSNEGTTFSTFTAAGFVRRSLQDHGFEVEKVRGFGRKREMLKGRYCG